MNDIYVNNHNPKYNYCTDLRLFNKLPNSELPIELFNLDILDGSPPCTTFSMAGNREEDWGKKKKFREGQQEQTLDDLSFVFIETVKKLKPNVVIMENVEGLLLGEAWSYVQRIYKEFSDIGYSVNHWLLKGETMGVPQTRRRVFFVAVQDWMKIDLFKIDMGFNYKPILYEDIKEGKGRRLRPDSQVYKALCLANRSDKKISEVWGRIGERHRGFTDMIAWDDSVLPTIKTNAHCYRGREKTCISREDIIHAQTFPEDYNFGSFAFANVAYVCGMSVPPVMMKRIVLRLIEQGVFDYKLKR